MNTDQSFSQVLLSKIPFSWRIIDNISQLNPKYDIFQELTSRRDERILQQSLLSTPDSLTDYGIGNLLMNKGYHQYMYAGMDTDKIRRLQDYRRMAGYSILNDCIEEICDEMWTEDEKIRYAVLKLNEELQQANKALLESQKGLKKAKERFETVFNINPDAVTITRVSDGILVDVNTRVPFLGFPEYMIPMPFWNPSLPFDQPIIWSVPSGDASRFTLVPPLSPCAITAHVPSDCL
jgi:hypothetical protein